MLTNSLRYCLCCRQWSLFTCKISNRYFKRRNKEKKPPTTFAAVWLTVGLRSTGPAQHMAREHSTSPRYQAQASCFQIPCLSPFTGTHLALHSGNFKPSKGNKVIVIMIASKHHSCGLTASGCGRLDETDCDSQEIRN